MDGLTRERWQQLRVLLDQALDLPPERRDAFLSEACGDDAALRAELEALLEAEARAGTLLESPVAERAGELVQQLVQAAPEPDALLGHQVGAYRLLHEIGRGGMGSVYLAERMDGQFEQRVAVKLLRRGLDTDDVLRRFLAERQILASLSHPQIAHLLDGGATPDGRPYLVMEYVEGEPIDVYCDTRRLSITERLALFLDVARAVQYAHRNLVVHRDLKPANILVSASGQVKLLDFGIARLLEARGEMDGERHTVAGLRMMTPEYASPEQVRGDAVTTASDVYQLGLLLYELLTGDRPYRLTGRSPSEIERVICQEQAPRPSTTLLPRRGTDSGGDPVPRTTPEQAAAARRTTPQRLHRQLRGDLDAIISTALRKEPQERYASAEALVEDLERWLAGQPVRARGDAWTYRARRFAGRHRWALSAAAAFVLLLGAYAATVSVQASRVRRALAQARLEAEKSAEVTEFLIGLFEAGEPSEGWGVNLTGGELLERGVRRADELRDRPELQAQLLEVIGRTYQRVGEFDEAQPLYERALALRQQVHGAQDADVARSLHDLGDLLRVRGRHAPAESLLTRAVEMRRALLGPEHADLATSLFELGRLMHMRGELDRAESLLREALAMRRAVLGEGHSETGAALTALALLLWARGDAAAAEPFAREALAVRRSTVGPEHFTVAGDLTNLGLVLLDRGEFAAAEQQFRDALGIGRRSLGEDHYFLSGTLNNLAVALREQERYTEADSLLERALALSGPVLGDDHPNVAHYLLNLGRVRLARGDAAAAEPLLRRSLEIRRAALAAGDWQVADAEGFLGECLAALGRSAEAEPLLLASLAGLERRWGAGDRRTEEARRRVVAFYDATGRPAEAERYRAAAGDAPVQPTR